MTEPARPTAGAILWHDLTVPDADAVRAFYEGVVGWTPSPVDMGGYSDFSMIAPGSGEVVAGICNARGPNADFPAQWLMYIGVEDVDACAARCLALGGEVIHGPRTMGGGRFCVVRDPAGAVAGLYQTLE